MFLLSWYLCIMTESTFLLFLNLVDWYVNDIFLLQHDVLILEIFIMLFSFSDNVSYTDHWYTLFSLRFSHVISDYDFSVFIVVFQSVFHITVLLIIFFHFVMHIFRILMNSTDFIFSFCDILYIHCYDMLFNMIIYMSLNFYFS